MRRWASLLQLRTILRRRHSLPTKPPTMEGNWTARFTWSERVEFSDETDDPRLLRTVVFEGKIVSKEITL